MLDKTGKADIERAIDDLALGLGVNEHVPPDEFLVPLHEGNPQECVQRIAARLTLPVRIVLLYVSNGDGRCGEVGFDSRHLARTDASGGSGGGVEGIAAQVLIPGSLPTYGQSLKDYPIQVRISKNSVGYPFTFIAIMAHELSHVLLKAIRHMECDNELYADLVPLILGFSRIVELGRKMSVCTSSGRTQTTRTTTYGYLDDRQFQHAYEYANEILLDCRREKQNLAAQAERVRQLCAKATHLASLFRECIERLDAQPERKTKKRDIAKIIQFHSVDYGRTWDPIAQEGTVVAEKAEGFAAAAATYSSNTMSTLAQHRQELTATEEHLNDALQSLKEDVVVLKRNVGWVYRLRSFFRKRWRPHAAS